MEVLLGNHTETFPGMINGTPHQGDTGDLISLGSVFYVPLTIFYRSPTPIELHLFSDLQRAKMPSNFADEGSCANVMPPSAFTAFNPRVPSDAVPDRTIPIALLVLSPASDRRK